jgi:hypothetical protein
MYNNQSYNNIQQKHGPAQNAIPPRCWITFGWHTQLDIKIDQNKASLPQSLIDIKHCVDSRTEKYILMIIADYNLRTSLFLFVRIAD